MTSSEFVGQVLLERYRVDAFIATGGMATVFQVYDLRRNVALAMKVLHADLAEDPAMYERFKREANALQNLAHPNIVPFYGLYQTADFPFMLERFIDGSTLKDMLRNVGRNGLPYQEVLIFMKAICSALSYAHSSGVVHCDIKPGNVMVDRGGDVYLADFGIARHVDSTLTTLAAAGTPAYMAPEQVRGESVSPVTDIYALGATLFEMLTGERMFRGTEKSAEKGGNTPYQRIRYAHLMLPPPDPRTLNPRIPLELAQVMLKAVEKVPSNRFQSTSELMTALAHALDVNMSAIDGRIDPARVTAALAGAGQSVSSPTPPGHIPPVPPTLLVNPPAVWPANALPQKKPKPLWLIALAGAVLMIGLILAFNGGGRKDISPTPVVSAERITNPANMQTHPVPSAQPKPTVTFTPWPSATALFFPPDGTSPDDCPGAEPQRVKVNQKAIVCTQQDRLILREVPDLSGKEIIRIVTGTKFNIIGGPSCANSSSWWQIHLETNVTGWVREGSDEKDLYFICPVN